MPAPRFVSLATLALAACGDPQKPTTPTTPGSGAAPAAIDDDAVLEAVYLHEIAAAHPTADEGLCLRVRNAGGATADASASLLAAVRRHHPTAVPASACSGGGRDPVRVIDPGRAGIMFDIGPVVRGPGKITVEGGGGHRGGGSIREVEYTVEPGPDGGLHVSSERVLRET
jgi:hypothetical protein